MKKKNILSEVHNSGKPYIIYKSTKGFDLYTDFSKKTILNKKNIYKFLNRKNNIKKSKDTDLLIGFFGYELLNNLIGIKVPKQKNIDFPKGIFYKPEKIPLGKLIFFCIGTLISIKSFKSSYPKNPINKSVFFGFLVLFFLFKNL